MVVVTPDTAVDDILQALDKLASPQKRKQPPFGAQRRHSLSNNSSIDEIEAALAAFESANFQPSVSYGLEASTPPPSPPPPPPPLLSNIDDIEAALHKLSSPVRQPKTSAKSTPAPPSPLLSGFPPTDSVIDDIHTALNGLMRQDTSAASCSTDSVADSVVDEIHEALNKLLDVRPSPAAHRVVAHLQSAVKHLAIESAPPNLDAVDTIHQALDRLSGVSDRAAAAPLAVTLALSSTNNRTPTADAMRRNSGPAAPDAIKSFNGGCAQMQLRSSIEELISEAKPEEVMHTLQGLIEDMRAEQQAAAALGKALTEASRHLVGILSPLRGHRALMEGSSMVMQWKQNLEAFKTQEQVKRIAMRAGGEADPEDRWKRFEAADLNWIRAADFSWVSPTAGEVKRLEENNFRKLALRWHPDKFSQKFGSRLFNGDRQQIHTQINEVFRAIANARRKG